MAVKGGTALKKLFYPGYRFSEDLDYSTLIIGSYPGVREHMETAITLMADRLFDRGPFQVRLEPLVLPLPHPGQQIAYIVRVQFPEQPQAMCRLKVEITVDEPILLPVEYRPLLHSFDEPFAANVACYALAEIVAEKLRALLQSRSRLMTRGWGASRVCRDYYDLWCILRREGRLGGQIPVLIESKCKHRGVAFAHPQDFIANELLVVAGNEWDQQLRPFVPQAPGAEAVLAEVQSLILALWD